MNILTFSSQRSLYVSNSSLDNVSRPTDVTVVVLKRSIASAAGERRPQLFRPVSLKGMTFPLVAVALCDQVLFVLHFAGQRGNVS